jgi:putative membrane protein
MKKASDLFTDEQKQQIDQAVIQAEAQTSAEIVPVVATASGRYDRPEDIAGLWLGVLGLVAAWLLLPNADNSAGSWGGWQNGYNLAIMILAVVVGFVVGAVIAAKLPGLRRLLTSRAEMTDDVLARTREMFAGNQIHRTRDATGLLIYISLFERMARIEADATIIEKLGQDAINALAATLTQRLREGDPAAALCETITQAGQQLAPLLPRPADDTDELPNALVLLD